MFESATVFLSPPLRALQATQLLTGFLQVLDPKNRNSLNFSDIGRRLANVTLAATEPSVDKLKPFLLGFLDRLTTLLPTDDKNDPSKWRNFGEQLAGLLHPRLYLAPSASAQN